MSKMIIAMSLAALIWVLPVQSMGAFQPEKAPGLEAYLKQIDFSEEIIPVSGRFSIHVRPRGTFAYGRFGGRGFQKFGHKKFYPYKYGGYSTYKYGNYPYIYGRDRFNTDRFFYDRYSRFGSPYSYYSPFGTRRPGW